MSLSQAVGAVAGIAVGFFTESPQAGFATYAAVSGVGAYLEQPDQEGPRLEDLKVQLSTYGADIPFGYGTVRQTGTIFWPKVLELIEHKTSESAKGGPEANSYSYTGSFAVLLRKGRIAGVRRMWKNKKLVYDVSVGSTTTKDPGLGTIRFYLGTDRQEPDPLMEAKDGPSPAYLGYAYVMFEDSDMTDTQGRVAQWEFEVITNGAAEIPETTSFGEAYGVFNDALANADMDANGHLWVSSMTGHAVQDATTGEWVIDPTSMPTPQIQEYDAATNELLWAYNVPPIAESYDGGPPTIIYPIKGTGVYSGGYYFTGRGAPGWPSTNIQATPYVHGMAVNTTTRAVAYMMDQCSSSQFQNAFYWPGVPVPVINNNKVYFAANNGSIPAGGSVSVGFMPASIQGTPDTDPTPDYSGAEALWNVPAGWAQSRAKNMTCPLPPDNDFDGTALLLPNWAYKSTAFIDGPTIVQGYGPSGNGTYITWVAHAPPVSSFDLSAPSLASTGFLPGSTTTMPSIAWDAKNSVLWAFAGAGVGTYNMLFAITPGPDGLNVVNTGFAFPAVPGESEGGDVKGMAIDEATGNLRLILGGGVLATASLVLFDPMTQSVLDSSPITEPIVSTIGRMWDVPEQGKVIFANGFKIYDIPYGSPLSANPVNLGTIVADICDRAGLPGDDIDVSQLTDMVDGYIIPRQMSGRAAIEPLQTAFFFDAVESDDKLKFVKRGAGAPILISMEDRAAREFGSDLPDSLSIVRAQDMELPVQCDVEYADIDADHLVGNQYSRRLTKDTKQRINIQSPVVMNATKAKQVADVTLYRAWLNQSYKFSTTRKWAHVEPTDLVTLPTESASYTARIVGKREQPGGVIEWEAAMEGVEVYTQSGAGAAPTNYVKQTIYDPGTTTLALLDIPILRDADNNAGFYVSMAGTADGWKGAQLFKSSDGGSTYEPVLTQTSEAAIGFAQSALPDFAEGNIIDAGSSVAVNMSSGQPLASVTEDQLFNGANLAVIGAPGRWEVVQFKTATLVAPNTYQLSGFLRGRRGTEWATGTHQAGDQFILASVNTWSRINAGDMGLPRLYKAPPFRVALSASSATSFTDTAVGLKPFAPVDLVGARDGSNNLALSWNRRTRLAADTLHLPRPLGEAGESYSVDIISGGAVVRTLTSSTASVIYSAADQATDGITPGAAVAVAVYQISAEIGRGYPLEATV